MMEWFQNSIYLVWLLIGLGFLFAEFFIPGLVVLFFGIGAFAVALIQFIHPLSMNMQVVIFVIVSVMSLFLLRRWFKRLFTGFTREHSDGLQDESEYSGEKAEALSQIGPGKRGKIAFHGSQWEADSDDDIQEGETVIIVKQVNIRFIVKKTV